MQTSIVRLSEVREESSDLRYEAEFFLKEYIELDNIINKNTISTLGKLATFKNGEGYESEEFGKGSTGQLVYVCKIGDVTNKREFKEWDIIPVEHFNTFKSASYCQHGDILITLTGDPPDVGKVFLLHDIPVNLTTWNQRVARIRLKNTNQIVSQYMLYITLSTKYCRKHIERRAKGIRQRNIGNPDVLNMKIPLFSEAFQTSIEQLVKKAHALMEESKTLYSESEAMLLRELGLTDWTPTKTTPNVSIVNKSKVDEAVRMDAEYYQPHYEDIIHKIKSYKGGYKKLGDLVEVNNSTFFPQDNEMYRYVEIGSVNVGNGEITPSEVIGSELPANAKIPLRKGDFIISTVRTYRGGITYITEDDLIGSGAFATFKIKEAINNETLFVLLKTKPFLELSNKQNVGTSYPTLSNEHVLNFLIPLIDESVQKSIAEKIQCSFTTRATSRQLLDLAKQTVEHAIETDEVIAKKHMNDSIKGLSISL